MITKENVQARRAMLVHQHGQQQKALADAQRAVMQIDGAVQLCDEMLAQFAAEEESAKAATAAQAADALPQPAPVRAEPEPKPELKPEPAAEPQPDAAALAEA